MTTCSNSCCCSDPCYPKPVEVSIQVNEYTITTVEGTLHATWAPGSNPLVDAGELAMWLEADDGSTVLGAFLFNVWFVDFDDATAAKTVNPPSVPGANEVELVADKLTGIASLNVQHTLAQDTWYAVVAFSGVTKVVGPISLGV